MPVHKLNIMNHVKAFSSTVMLTAYFPIELAATGASSHGRRTLRNNMKDNKQISSRQFYCQGKIFTTNILSDSNNNAVFVIEQQMADAKSHDGRIVGRY